MRESLVNREGDRPLEKRKGREETRNWSLTQGWEATPEWEANPQRTGFVSYKLHAPRLTHVFLKPHEFHLALVPFFPGT
jgi:hypothetical protein